MLSNVDLLSNCERDFIKTAVSEDKRVDRRTSKESRNVRVSFGLDRGCCVASLGDTKVLVQVSAEIIVPKPGRPTEGELFVNLELSPMAAPHFEAGRLGDYGVEVSRLLERCIRDSHCIDLESLCVVSGEKVWALRVDAQVLNHQGNIVECAGIATIGALMHFRRPDVTVIGTEVTVHNPRDREPVPLHLHHYPFLVCFAFYDDGKTVLIDPTDLEERIAEGLLFIAANAHEEICLLHQHGCTVRRDLVLLCSRLASVRAKTLAEKIKAEIAKDDEGRMKNRRVGFAAALEVDEDEHLTTMLEPESIEIDDMELQEPLTERPITAVNTPEVVSKAKVFLEGLGTAVIGKGGPSKWGVLEHSDHAGKNAGKGSRKRRGPSLQMAENRSDSSEEEEVIVLQPEDTNANTRAAQQMESTAEDDEGGSSRGWYPRTPF
ncbi:exosome complex component RRP45 [Dermacentor albipictus]|uniref:exosome complex component RRP45 n=1 Tax=Dermacentor albipictus TaxID=60249 RepID=UPI0038FCC637